MKILAISGSPRKGGNTEILLRQAMDGVRETDAKADVELLRVAEKDIKPCKGCDTCRKTGKCNIDDDMQEIYNQLINADGIILGTPVYIYSMTGQLKIFLDRTYALGFPEMKMRSKVGGSIVVGGRTATTLTAALFYIYFANNHMLACDYVIGYAIDKGEIRKDKHAMYAAFELGKQMALLAKSQFKFPEEYKVPIYRHVLSKYGVPISPVSQQ